MQMLESLVSGRPASALFKSLMGADDSLDARALDNILGLEYPNISPGAFIAIRRWFNLESGFEVSDEDLDALIAHYLKEAGYIG
jgi:hypothetical protein